MTPMILKTALLSATLASALLGGCATTTADCNSDWYAIGARDGRLGATPQADYYATRCAAPVDRARYQSGWENGSAQRPLPGW